MGAGNDGLVFNGSALNASVDMGAGNNTMELNLANLSDFSDFYRQFTFGDGNDTMSIFGGNGDKTLAFASVDLGNGTNVLNVDGTAFVEVGSLTLGTGADTISIGAGCKLTINDAFDAASLENLVIADGGILQLNDEASCISAKNKFAAVADRIISPA